MTITVITGCSTGIGYATAIRCASDGHRVIATMRNPSASDLTDVAAQRGLDIDVRALDVDDDESVESLFKGVVASHGEIDVLINNAGIGQAGVLEEADLDTFRAVMETNYFGVLRCTKAVLPSMRERGSGCIVTVSSQAGRFSAPGMGPYSASKYAIEGAMEALAIEVAPFGVRVSLIEPGAILTAIWTKVDMTPPSGPYTAIRNRLGLAVITDVSAGSPSEEVADCIAQAVAADPPILRWLVGQGAERNVANRHALSDEEWIAVWNGPENEFKAKVLTERTD